MVLVGEIDRPRRLLARAIAVPPAETAGEEFRVSEILARLQQQAIYNESTSERLWSAPLDRDTRTRDSSRGENGVQTQATSV
jgi:hypothetical protein